MFKYQNGQKVKVDEKEVVEGFEMPDMNKKVMIRLPGTFHNTH